MKSSWDKKIHVQSSMAKKEGQWHLFIGRWQPLHDGHKQMFQQILDAGGNVCIAIREGDVDDKNPYTANQVYANINKEYSENIHLMKNVKVIIIPDVCSVNFGRGVGYDIVEHIPPTEIAEISATKIREQMKSSL
jgi:phosphopantetheine adenylyltransferase